jgi:hypothetical protein
VTSAQRSAPRKVGRVALGAYRDARRRDPHGLADLGRAFLPAHDGDVVEAVGALLLRVSQLEREVKDLKGVDAGRRLAWIEGEQ